MGLEIIMTCLWNKIRHLASIWCKVHDLFGGIFLSNTFRDWKALFFYGFFFLSFVKSCFCKEHLLSFILFAIISLFLLIIFFFLTCLCSSSSMNIYLFSPIFAFGSRRQHEEELKLLEEETARRIEEAIRKNVEEKLDSEEVRLEIERRIAEGVKKLFDDVEAQLEKEKEDALTEARRKEVSRLAGSL